MSGARSAYQKLIMLSIAVYLVNSLWQTLLPLYLDNKGFTVRDVGVATMLVSSLPWILALVAGLLVERLPWKSSISLALFILALTVFSLTWATTELDLILVLVLAGFSLALFTQASVEIIAETRPRRRLGFSFASYYAGLNFAKTAGSFLSGVIVSLWNYWTLYAFSSALFLLLSLVALISFPKGRAEKARRVDFDALKVIAESGEVLLLTATIIVHDFAIFIGASYLALYAKKVIGLSEFEYSLIIAAKSLVLILLQPFSGMLADRVGEVKVLAVHFVTTAVCYALYSFAGSFTEALLVSLLMGFSVSLDLPARRSLISKLAPQRRFAATSGFLDMLVGLSTLPSPLIGAYLWNAVSPHAAVITGGLANLAALIPLSKLSTYAEKDAV